MVLPESLANRFAVVVGPAAGQQAIDQLRLGHIECQHQIERHAALGQHAVERFGLGDGPRKTIEQAAASAVLFRKAITDDADHDLIGHELAGVHVAGRFAAELGAGLVGFAQHLAGREMGEYADSPSAAGLASPFQRRADQGRRCAWGAFVDFGLRISRLPDQ